MSNWQPIETAPKDGTEILVRYPHQGNVKQLVNWSKLRGYWQSKGDPQLSLPYQEAEWHPLPPDGVRAGEHHTLCTPESKLE